MAITKEGHTTFEYDESASSDGPALKAERCPCCRGELRMVADFDFECLCLKCQCRFRAEHLALARRTADAREAEWQDALHRACEHIVTCESLSEPDGLPRAIEDKRIVAYEQKFALILLKASS